MFPVFDIIVSMVGSETVFGLCPRRELIGVQREESSEDVDFDGSESADSVLEIAVVFAGCACSDAAVGDCACLALMPVPILISTQNLGSKHGLRRWFYSRPECLVLRID